MATLKEDIKTQSDWIVKAFAEDDFKLDYTIDSFIEIDKFFNKNLKNGKPKKGGRLAKKGFGPILFSIGSYVGETIIKNVNGAEWITDDNDPQGELKVSMKLPNGTEIWPIQKVIKRFQNGSEDAIYPYAYSVTKEFINQPFNEQYWTVTAERDEANIKKTWWKFW
jgi:hypothetical protein